MLSYEQEVKRRDPSAVLRWRQLGNLRWCRVEVVSGPLTGWYDTEDGAWKACLAFIVGMENLLLPKK